MTDLFGEIDVEGMYRMALAVPLQEKIESAIGLIRLYEQQALTLSDDGYYVAFSGGKDSIVMAKLFEMAGVEYTLNYSNVTIDPPELVQFLKREYPQAIWHSQGKPLPMAMSDKSCGPPTRLIRWCCQLYKEQGGNGSFKAIGVRAAESARRKGLWKTVNNNNGGHILCPIVYWTDADVWAFIRANNMPYCTLYDEGFKRLGCVGCPMGGKNRIKEFARWPKHEKLWKRGFKAYFDKYKGTLTKAGNPRSLDKFDTVDDLWNWWMETPMDDTDQPDCQQFLW
jgi:phosphoadenosine phosphosulfate reductase